MGTCRSSVLRDLGGTVRADMRSAAAVRYSLALPALVAVTIGVVVLGSATAQPAGEVAASRVELRDGRVLKGAIRQVGSCLYLLQSADALYEVAGEEIVAVDGKPGVSAVPATGERLIRYERAEVVRPNGDVDLWSKAHVTNNGKSALTYIQWGAKESELEMIRTMEAWGGFGHRLTHRIEPRHGTDLYDVFVDLATPVAPGSSRSSQLQPCESRTAAARRSSGAVTIRAGSGIPSP